MNEQNQNRENIECMICGRTKNDLDELPQTGVELLTETKITQCTKCKSEYERAGLDDEKDESGSDLDWNTRVSA